jgi:general secretion pathway protein D
VFSTVSANFPYFCAVLCLAGALLSGCQSGSSDPNSDSVFANGIFSNISPRDGKNSRDDIASTGRLTRSNNRLTQDFAPDRNGLVPMDANDPASAGQYSLNFENTDIKEVARAILNDALHVNYTISGDVSGPVTISSARPVSREALLSSLESALGAFNFSLVKTGDSYRITATGLTVGTVDKGRRTTAGYGVSIIPLRFVTADNMMELVSGFVTQAEGLRISAARNVIIARGTSPQRAEVVEAVLSFDSDFMQSQSVSIFRLVQARPDDVVPELERIFSVKGENGLIQFRSVNRIRGVMAISKNPALMRRAETWVRRLDQQDSDTGQNVVIYKAKYRKAAELAAVMNNLFGGAAANPTTQTVPATPTQSQNQQTETGETSQNSLPTATNTASSNTTTTQSRIDAAFSNSNDTNANLGLQTGPNIVDLTSAATSNTTLRISADPSNNSVVIYGDSEQAQQVLVALKKLDSTPIQVAINVTIAEVKLTNELKYGVQYFLKSKKFGLGTNNGSLSLTDGENAILSRQDPGLNFVVGAAANPDVIITALDTVTDVEVLSSPSLVVVENQTATLQVGDEVPITTQQAQSTIGGNSPVINQVEFKDTGIILNVTPRIGQNDAVTMDIEQEISNVSSGANTLTPTISKRSIKSQISVNDQQTVVLGGLISANAEKQKAGVPGLSNVPILGNMFSTTAKTRGRNELIVLIRPVIIRDAQDAANVADSLRSQMTVLKKRTFE